MLSQKHPFKLRKIQTPDNSLYVLDPSSEIYSIAKQVQEHIKSSYRLQMPRRFDVINRVIETLKTDRSKTILITDFQKFFENILHDQLLNKLTKDAVLDKTALESIAQLLHEYKECSGQTKGVPRGVGISTYLAELYVQDLDKCIQSLSGVTFYSRFADDIIIAFHPSEQRDFLNEITHIAKSFGFILNDQKTSVYPLTPGSSAKTLNYLGYKISFGGNTPVHIRLTESKIERYKHRLDVTFDAYLAAMKHDEKNARKLLVKRIRFLTGNTRLTGKNSFIGIYYSNSHLTDFSDLDTLDSYLKNKIETKIHLPQLKNRLSKFSYKDSFLKKKFSPFSALDIAKITKIWENET